MSFHAQSLARFSELSSSSLLSKTNNSTEPVLESEDNRQNDNLLYCLVDQQHLFNIATKICMQQIIDYAIEKYF